MATGAISREERRCALGSLFAETGMSPSFRAGGWGPRYGQGRGKRNDQWGGEVQGGHMECRGAVSQASVT